VKFYKYLVLKALILWYKIISHLLLGEDYYLAGNVASLDLKPIVPFLYTVSIKSKKERKKQECFA